MFVVSAADYLLIVWIHEKITNDAILLKFLLDPVITNAYVSNRFEEIARKLSNQKFSSENFDVEGATQLTMDILRAEIFAPEFLVLSLKSSHPKGKTSKDKNISNFMVGN